MRLLRPLLWIAPAALAAASRAPRDPRRSRASRPEAAVWRVLQGADVAGLDDAPDAAAPEEGAAARDAGLEEDAALGFEALGSLSMSLPEPRTSLPSVAPTAAPPAPATSSVSGRLAFRDLNVPADEHARERFQYIFAEELRAHPDLVDATRVRITSITGPAHPAHPSHPSLVSPLQPGAPRRLHSLRSPGGTVIGFEVTSAPGHDDGEASLRQRVGQALAFYRVRSMLEREKLRALYERFALVRVELDLGGPAPRVESASPTEASKAPAPAPAAPRPTVAVQAHLGFHGLDLPADALSREEFGYILDEALGALVDAGLGGTVVRVLGMGPLAPVAVPGAPPPLHLLPSPAVSARALAANATTEGTGVDVEIARTVGTRDAAVDVEEHLREDVVARLDLGSVKQQLETEELHHLFRNFTLGEIEVDPAPGGRAPKPDADSRLTSAAHQATSGYCVFVLVFMVAGYL